MISTQRRHAIAIAAATCALLVALAAVLAGGSGASAADAAGTGTEPERPNIIMIMTDDQQNSTVDAMPFISSRKRWVEFDSAMVNTALCCPSRATLLTGRTSERHGILSNSETAEFNGQSTIADWLNESGYQTGFVGKYLNKFPWAEAPEFIPSGWDYWAAYSGKQGYFNYTLNENGILTEEKGQKSYSTDVFTERMVEFIDTAEAGRPLFGMVSFFGPHSPWTPAERHQDADVAKLKENRSFMEKDVSDKPTWVQNLPIPDVDVVREDRIRHQRALLSVDEGVKAIFKALKRKGELDNTLVMYSSDHGIGLGDHRYTKKTCGYEICSRVPLLIRAPGVKARTEEALVSNIDFTPTFADYAGIKTSETVDGRSLRKLLEGRRDQVHKKGVYLRRAQGSGERIFAGIRTAKWKYLNYGRAEERELYNLKRDPFEVRNLLATNRAKWVRKADELHEQMDDVRKTPSKIR